MVDLNELALFFGDLPAVDESDVTWDVSGASFRFENGVDVVQCFLAPTDGRITLAWFENGSRRVELSLTNYFQVQLERRNGATQLVAVPQDRQLSPLVLQLRPAVFIGLGRA